MVDYDAPATLLLKDVTVQYDGFTALDHLNVEVPHGAQVAVVGPNGAGKSTLFKALVGLVPLRSGTIHIHGRPLGSHKDCVAYIPQREEVDWRFPVTVEDVVMMGRYKRFGWFNQPSEVDREVVIKSLEQMGLASLAKRTIGELSGGQQQRVFLARAISQQPHILLMDEPFNGVDAATQEVTLSLLDDLKQKQVTVLVSTHDLRMAAERFESVMLLSRKLIAFGPSQEVFSEEHIKSVFSGQVLFMNGAAVVDQCCCPDEHEHGEAEHD